MPLSYVSYAGYLRACPGVPGVAPPIQPGVDTIQANVNQGKVGMDVDDGALQGYQTLIKGLHAQLHGIDILGNFIHMSPGVPRMLKNQVLFSRFDQLDILS
jgi:hypothetical protein